jgi:beta-lactamase superfamily II metal-dependent hydrolase
LGGSTNESSLALRVEYGDFAAQFVGDLGFEEEEELLASGRLSPDVAFGAAAFWGTGRSRAGILPM